MKKVILIVGTEGRGQVSRFKIDRRRLERRGQWRKGLESRGARQEKKCNIIGLTPF